MKGEEKKQLTLYEKDRRKKIWKVAVSVALVFIIAAFAFFIPFRKLLPAYPLSLRQEGELRIHFLSVGQADCTVIEFPDGEAAVVDGGDGSWESRTHISRYLKGLGIAVPSLIVTHADIDHYGGMEEIIEYFGAKELYLPVLGSDRREYTDLLERAEEEHVPVQTMSRYCLIANGSGAYLNCISPYSQGEEDANEASAVLWLSYSGVNVLLCGDISSEREERLMTEYSFDEALFDKDGYTVRLPQTDILKVAHHGSASASSAEWLQFLGAKTAIISCGRDNAYSHPAAATLTALSAVGSSIYRTDELGDITVAIADGAYSVTYQQNGVRI